jgi:hypothetical protein
VLFAKSFLCVTIVVVGQRKKYVKHREDLRFKIQKVYEDPKQIFGDGKIRAVLRSQGERVSQGMVQSNLIYNIVSLINDGALVFRILKSSVMS